MSTVIMLISIAMMLTSASTILSISSKIARRNLEVVNKTNQVNYVKEEKEHEKSIPQYTGWVD